jgi:hypothetical protein
MYNLVYFIIISHLPLKCCDYLNNGSTRSNLQCTRYLLLRLLSSEHMVLLTPK